MLKYAGSTHCPRCRSSLVREYDCHDVMQADAMMQGAQRLVCPACGFSRHMAYVVERPGKASATR